MKKISLFLLLFSIVFSEASHADSLHGVWKFVGMIYQGQMRPPLNQRLSLTWTFYPNGTDRLYWERDDEAGFCERFAHYELKDSVLSEEIFAVNPRNRGECAVDPDMQLTRQTFSKVEFQNNRMLLHLNLAEQELIYVFKEIL